MSFTVEALKAQEDACVLPSFDADVAWELGSLIRATCRAKHPDRPAVVSITHANAPQCLFFAASRPGTQPDNARWVERKTATVLRWGVSTMRMRAQLEAQAPGPGFVSTQQLLRDRYEVADPSAYACHGGGFPVRVGNVEGVVGVIVVSGLKQEDDHTVIVESIREYLAKRVH